MQEQQHLAAAERGVVDPGGADSALVEAVGGSSSEAIRLRRARVRAGGIARRGSRRNEIFHSLVSAEVLRFRESGAL